MSKFTAKKRLNNKYIPSIVSIGYEWAKSFNDETTLDKDTEYLIVGTLTPPDGRGKPNNKVFPGYFYCSEKNDMYMFLDKAFPNRKNKLVDLKNRFRESGWNVEIKEEIKEELKVRHVAFLDVIKEAHVKENSSKDNDIDTYILDKESFDNLPDDIKIVANSTNAKVALEYILNKQNIEMIPQSIRGNWNYDSKENLIETWKRFLNKERL